MFKALSVFFKMNIVRFVLISAAAGYGVGLAAEATFSFVHFGILLLGTFFISTGSLSLNQVQESPKDAKMERTQLRPVASGYFSRTFALSLSLTHIILGLSILYYVKPMSCYIAVVILVTYNLLYVYIWKPKWTFAAVPGALPGALPVTIGYAAVNDNILTPESIYMFLIMFLWQMPHYWTLAIKLRDDYAKADFPILPVVVGKERTIFHISFYVACYAFLALMSPFFVETYYFYYFLVIPFALIIVWQFSKFVKSTKDSAWLPFFLWTNFSLLAFLIAPLADKWTILLFKV